jgi:Di- and tripeptidases
MDTIVKVWYELEPAPEDSTAYRITVSGLKGGHSGDDINKNLANANKLLTRILWQGTNWFDLQLYDFQGGNLRNAIAREATAVAFIPEREHRRLPALCEGHGEALQARIPSDRTRTESHGRSGRGAARRGHRRDVAVRPPNGLNACPHGVIAMSQTIPNFVETSTNLASCKKKEGYFFIQTSQRSSIESSKQDIANMVEAVWSLADADVEHTDGYPGWAPNPDSAILDVAVNCYKKRFNKDPKVRPSTRTGMRPHRRQDSGHGHDQLRSHPARRALARRALRNRDRPDVLGLHVRHLEERAEGRNDQGKEGGGCREESCGRPKGSVKKAVAEKKATAEKKAAEKKAPAKKAARTKAPAHKSQAKKAVGSKKTASVQKAAVSQATAKQNATKRSPANKAAKR